MKLIVGLGNPGPSYTRTRHNVGFRVVDELARRAEIASGQWKSKYDGLFVKTHIGGDSAILLKPQTMMNASDTSVLRFKNWFKIPLHDVWVVLDDVDLPLGAVRVRASGSSAGHRGLDSILSRLQSENVPRFRLGIRSKVPIADTSAFVLEPFADDEQSAIADAVTRAADAIVHCIDHGFRNANNAGGDRPML